MLKSRRISTSFLKKNFLDKDVLVILLELAPKTQDSQVYKRHNIASFSLKSGRTQYKEGQKGRKNGKDKKDRKNGKDEKGGGDHYGNKVNPLVGKSSGFEASVYHHIIFQCY